MKCAKYIEVSVLTNSNIDKCQFDSIHAEYVLAKRMITKQPSVVTKLSKKKKFINFFKKL